MRRSKHSRGAKGSRRARQTKKLPENIAKAAEYQKPAKKTGAEILLLGSIIFIMAVLLAFSQYMVRTDLSVSILNQTSSCYSGQDSGSEAGWNKGNIAMETGFETPDPCYTIDSIKAMQQGDRIEVKIKVASGGICVQCFGFRKVSYAILSLEARNDLNIYVEIDSDGAGKQYVWLPLLG